MDEEAQLLGGNAPVDDISRRDPPAILPVGIDAEHGSNVEPGRPALRHGSAGLAMMEHPLVLDDYRTPPHRGFDLERFALRTVRPAVEAAAGLPSVVPSDDL